MGSALGVGGGTGEHHPASSVRPQPGGRRMQAMDGEERSDLPCWELRLYPVGGRHWNSFSLVTSWGIPGGGGAGWKEAGDQ